jgi:hypothetical protein
MIKTAHIGFKQNINKIGIVGIGSQMNHHLHPFHCAPHSIAVTQIAHDGIL